MIKRFPSSRNQRSKNIKVKHVLQVLLLVGVSFWLIYQVKHNHDKKREFDKHDAKLSVTTETDQIVKLGRKDLHPFKEEVNQNEKHGEEDEDEHIVEDEEKIREHIEQEEGNKHETEESEDNMHEGREEEEEENKHGAEVLEENEYKGEKIKDDETDENDQEKQEEEENKHGAEENEEDENKGEEEIKDEEAGDGETDENDQKKPEVDIDHDDEIVDEEKEKEDEGDEKENKDKEDEEKGGSVENDNNHEAREELYKGDDASSAVAHDIHATSTETETVNFENSHVSLEMNIIKPENKTTYSDESNTNRNDSDSKVTEGEATVQDSSNATAGKETGNDELSNTTAKANTDSHLEVSSNPTVTITEASSDSTEAGADISNSLEQNKTVILSVSDHSQNTTVNTVITGDAAAGETTTPIRFMASNETENTLRNLDRNVSSESDTSGNDKSKSSTETSEANETQNTDATEDEMFKGDTQTGETDEESDSSSARENLETVEHDAIDSLDTHIHDDVAEARTDLDTLPDIRTEGDNDEETAAE